MGPVTDYSTWEEEQVSVVTLLLDPRNPRIPGGEMMEQGELLAELVAHDKVYELAKDIANDGLYPLESLLAIEDDGNLYVVEGNRRLAALKLLTHHIHDKWPKACIRAGARGSCARLRAQNRRRPSRGRG